MDISLNGAVIKKISFMPVLYAGITLLLPYNYIVTYVVFDAENDPVVRNGLIDLLFELWTNKFFIRKKGIDKTWHFGTDFK